VIAGIGVLLNAATLLASPLEVGGDSDCPTAAEITRRVDELAPSEGPAAPAFVQVSNVGGRVRLELHGADGNALASRDLDEAASCDDLAAAAAVVVATWQNDLDPKASLPVELPAEPTPPAPAPQVVAAVEPTPPPPPRRRGLVGIGLLAAVADGAVAPGATLRASVNVGPRWLGVGAALGGTTSRAADVGDRAGAAAWTRAWLGVGPELRSDVTHGLQSHVQGLVGVLHVAGVDVPQAASDTMLDLGVGIGISATHWIGNAALWLGVDALIWPGQQRLILRGLPDEGRLPTVDLQVAAGIALGRGP
jgi:hypothetical protein